VPSFEDLHIQPSIAATLDQLGWSPDDPIAKEAAPTAARGHNLVAVTPPAPVYATPAAAGILSRPANGTRALVLVPAAQLNEWGALIHRLAGGTNRRIQIARGTARAMRGLRSDALDVLVTAPDTALDLVTRSALRMDTVSSLMVAWPELLLDEESITPLMQDLPKEAQRLIYTSEAGRVEAVVERYARKALTIGLPGGEPSLAGPVRTVSVPWSSRIQALADLVELLDPASLVVWTVDRLHHAAIAQAIAANQPELQLVTGDAPTTATILAFDLPTGERLRQLLTAGEVILLVPPGTEGYLARIAGPRRPLQLPGLLDAARSAEAAQRSKILQALEGSQLNRALLTLAPLFERHEPAAVAAALYELWTSSAPTTPVPLAEIPATSKIFVGVGKRDGVTANDLVGVLTKELRVDRTKIGRIELRDAYSLVELPTREAEQLASALNGVTIRRKRVTARVDRGSKRPFKSGSRV
jgi:ATP-dependent RNA helicase DeaD